MFKLICLNCGTDFERSWRKRKYCSHNCYSEAKKGKTAWNKGLKGIYSQELLQKMSDSRRGKHSSPTTEFRKGNVGVWLGKKRPTLKDTNSSKTMFKKGQTSGEKNYRWKGGITPEIRKIRNSTEYKEWRLKVFQRDRFTCVMCQYRSCKSRDIAADHIKPFSLFPELRFDVNNGRTLCVACHRSLPTSRRNNLRKGDFYALS